MAGFGNLSPMDSLKWFQEPKTTTFSLNTGLIKIAGADPMRVVLIIGSPAVNNSVVINTIPSASATVGLAIPTTAGFVEFTHATHGALVQHEWWANGAIGDNVTVIELALREWPRVQGDGRGPVQQAAKAARLRYHRDNRQSPDRA